MTVCVVGAGSWGTTVAALVAAHGPTVLWVRGAELAETIASTHENPQYLPGVALPAALRATASLEDACTDAEVVVVGVPSHGFRAVLTDSAPFIARDAAVISLSKGVEQGSNLRMTEVVAEVLEGHDAGRIGVLSGPNLAKEVAAGQPTATVRRFVCTRTPTSSAVRSRARSRTCSRSAREWPTASATATTPRLRSSRAASRSWRGWASRSVAIP